VGVNIKEKYYYYYYYYVVLTYRTDEVMLAKLSSVWTLIIFICVSQCLAAPTSQRETDIKAAAGETPLIRSMYSHPHTPISSDRVL